MPAHRARALPWALCFALCLGLAALATFPAAHSLRAQNTAKNNLTFRNTDPSIGYVGSQACAAAGCHEAIARAYPTTPMGHSMAPANTPAELARVPQPVTVFNEANKHYYEVYQVDGELYQSAYELDKKGRKLYRVAHKINWVVGSALTGYSYLFPIGPWIFQAPLSYYSHPEKWELSPGYIADDLGFTRSIGTGCLVCHNGQPVPDGKHDGKYKDPAFRYGELAISCEACHGPGELHVREMQAKKESQLAPQEVDSSIVNPAKLSPRLVDDLCRYCHQSGDTVVLLPGKGYQDFRPGTPLNQTWAFVKRPLKEEQRAEANRLETAKPVRGSLETPLWWKNSSLELSKCYQASQGRLTCISCHSIHHGAKPEDRAAYYRAKCLACHQAGSCKLAVESSARVQAGDNCIECHMERRAVAGIAHSNDTKHRIVRYPGQPLPEIAFEQPKRDLPGLLWLNRPTGETSAQLPAITQLEAYWTVAGKDRALAPFAMQKLDELSKTAPNDPVVLNCLGAVALAGKKDYAKASDYFSRAMKQGSEEPTTYLNLARALENQGRHQEAELILESGLATYPYSGALAATLALQYFNDGKPLKASIVIHQFRKVFPEDASAATASKQIEGVGNAGDYSGTPARNTTSVLPK